MIAAIVAIGSFGSLFCFWVMWMSVSALGRAKGEGRLSPLVISIGQAYALCGLVWDVTCNILLCTFLFLDFPREPTLSQRLRRLVKSEGWRQRLAVWIAVNLINPFSVDPSDPHIHL